MFQELYSQKRIIVGKEVTSQFIKKVANGFDALPTEFLPILSQKAFISLSHEPNKPAQNSVAYNHATYKGIAAVTKLAKNTTTNKTNGIIMLSELGHEKMNVTTNVSVTHEAFHIADIKDHEPGIGKYSKTSEFKTLRQIDARNIKQTEQQNASLLEALEGLPEEETFAIIGQLLLYPNKNYATRQTAMTADFIQRSIAQEARACRSR